MSKLCLLILLAALVVFIGAGCCCTETGSKEYVPGKGWVPAE